MEIWLDTIDRAAIEDARQSGLLHGITTNPSIISHAKEPLEDILEGLLNWQAGPVAVQVTANTHAEMVEQAKDLFDFSPRLFIKVPATPEGLKAIASLTHIGIPTMATAIFEPLQGLLAAKAGSAYAAPYFSHIGENNHAVIQSLHALFRTYQLPCKLLIAALNFPEQVLQCAQLGVSALTLKEALYYACCKPPANTLKFLAKFEEEWQTAPPSALLPKQLGIK